MSDSAVYEFVSGELESRTSLDRLESRGTVRLALKEAGLDPRTVSSDQMQVVLAKVLPGELEARGVTDAQAVCASIQSGLPSVGQSPKGDTPEAIFSRLGGGSQ